MSEPEEVTPSKPVQLVHPIETAVDNMLGALLNDEVKKEIEKVVGEKLAIEAVRHEFVSWLQEAGVQSSSASKWITLLQSGKIEEAIKNGIAADCLQVIVLAYLPGPRYFQGAYIKSLLRDAASLQKMKTALQIPHLTGAVGWMTARLLRSEMPDAYVALRDAQLDLRGRVAVSDLQLGNRSVAGFPVSMALGNKHLPSISGFVFLSHPLANIFPAYEQKDRKFAARLSEVRAAHENALASAIESYIFRRYGRFVLKSRQESTIDAPVPLLTLSHDDPTGFLASILFESSPSGFMSAECDVNEDVFLEIAAWHLRVASMHPEKWAPRFVQHMTRLGEMVERPNFDGETAMAWYPRSPPRTVGELYPRQAVAELTASLNHAGESKTWSEWNTGWEDEISNRVRKALADILQVYGTPSEQTYQADLVVPMCCKQDEVRHALGFFRINCDSSGIRQGKSAAAAFQNLWSAIGECRRRVEDSIGKLMFTLEAEYRSVLDAPPVISGRQSSGKQRAADIRRIKLWMDVSHLISDWLAQRMHQLVAALTNSKKLDEPDDTLILFAMQASATGRDHRLKHDFEACRDKWKQLLEEVSNQKCGGPFPEITLVSFWPRMKMPVINSIAHAEGGNLGAEDEFAVLLLADPGLLRMITILAPILGPRESVNLAGDLDRDPEEWGDVNFGVPTEPKISKLQIARSPDVPSSALDLTWSFKEDHNLRLIWDNDKNRRRLGSHAVSSVPGTVARRLGKNLLEGVQMALPAASLNQAQQSSTYPDQYYSVTDFVASPDGLAFRERLRLVEHVMFFGSEGDAAGSWRILEVKSKPRAFLAALCDRQVERPIVLAFRDFALANAKAFYVAREFDSQRKAAEEYTRNMSAVAHGYKGPVLKLSEALEEATAEFRTNLEETFVADHMAGLQAMVKATRTLAEDAISYAWRKDKAHFKKLEPLGWKKLYDGQNGLEDGVRTVITALDVPKGGRISFNNTDFVDKILVDSSLFLWRHLLSKLVENGIEHTKDPKGSRTSPKVFLRAFLRGSYLVLEIRNFVLREDLSATVARVRAGLREGVPDTSKENHGYGLIEAFNCCRLLAIEPEVTDDQKNSHLLIELPMILTEGASDESTCG